jgi:hypothetical protein
MWPNAVAAARRLPLYTTNPDDFLGAEGTVNVIAGTRPATVRLRPMSCCDAPPKV